MENYFAMLLISVSCLTLTWISAMVLPEAAGFAQMRVARSRPVARGVFGSGQCRSAIPSRNSFLRVR